MKIRNKGPTKDPINLSSPTSASRGNKSTAPTASLRSKAYNSMSRSGVSTSNARSDGKSSPPNTKEQGNKFLKSRLSNVNHDLKMFMVRAMSDGSLTDGYGNGLDPSPEGIDNFISSIPTSTVDITNGFDDITCDFGRRKSWESLSETEKVGLVLAYFVSDCPLKDGVEKVMWIPSDTSKGPLASNTFNQGDYKKCKVLPAFDEDRTAEQETKPRSAVLTGSNSLLVTTEALKNEATAMEDRSASTLDSVTNVGNSVNEFFASVVQSKSEGIQENYDGTSVAEDNDVGGRAPDGGNGVEEKERTDDIASLKRELGEIKEEQRLVRYFLSHFKKYLGLVDSLVKEKEINTGNEQNGATRVTSASLGISVSEPPGAISSLSHIRSFLSRILCSVFIGIHSFLHNPFVAAIVGSCIVRLAAAFLVFALTYSFVHRLRLFISGYILRHHSANDPLPNRVLDLVMAIIISVVVYKNLGVFFSDIKKKNNNKKKD